jgi:hypothetical protein
MFLTARFHGLKHERDHLDANKTGIVRRAGVTGFGVPALPMLASELRGSLG